MNYATLEDLKKLSKEEKDVTLPNGLTFRIKAVNGRDLIALGILPVMGIREIMSAKKEDEEKPNLTEKQLAEIKNYHTNLIIAGVVSPQLTKENVSLLDDGSFYFLREQIDNLSFGGQDLKPFREEQNTTIAGQVSEPIQSSTDPNITTKS